MMEDAQLGDCEIVIQSYLVPLSEGAGGNGGSVHIPCLERFGGVDAIRRVNKHKVEVIVWHLKRKEP